MAGELETPSDSITGLPLTVKVTPDQLGLKGRNHHPNHPNKRPELANSIGRALRYSRVYWMPDELHMGHKKGSYHNIFWGPWMGQELDDAIKYRLTALNLARVVPREALVLDGTGGYEKTALSDEEYLFMTSEQITTVVDGNGGKKKDIRRNLIGHALVEYALGQGVTDLVSGRRQERLLRSTHEATVAELGSLMIHRAVEESLRPAVAVYQEAAEAGMVVKREDLSHVIRGFLPEHEFGQYYESIKRAILTNKELAVAA